MVGAAQAGLHGRDDHSGDQCVLGLGRGQPWSAARVRGWPGPGTVSSDCLYSVVFSSLERDRVGVVCSRLPRTWLDWHEKEKPALMVLGLTS